jgi:hypothetical protein
MKNLIICLFITVSINMSAVDLFVYPGASSPDFSSIATAVDSASDGDRILVSSGNYVGDINIYEKTISILPTVSSSQFTIQGDIIFHRNNTAIVTKEITISSAEFLGKIEYLGNISSPYEINLINCIVLNEVDLKADDIFTNFYYSSFYSSIYLNASFEIVGNYFQSTSLSGDTLFIEDAIWNSSNSLSSNKIKVYANNFKNFSFKFLTNGNSIISNLHIANNYMDETNGSNSALISLDCPNASCLIENNTFLSNHNSVNANGNFFDSHLGLNLLEVRNNFILNRSGQMQAYNFLFSFTGNSLATILKIENNFFNETVVLPYGAIAGGGDIDKYIYGVPYATFIYDNVFTSTYMGSNIMAINDTSGIPSYSILLSITEDAGKDIIECRDIDNTRNNIGPSGGPHSWFNYHQSSVGTARVIDININPSINAITNGSLQINAKSVNTNQ